MDVHIHIHIHIVAILMLYTSVAPSSTVQKFLPYWMHPPTPCMHQNIYIAHNFNASFLLLILHEGFLQLHALRLCVMDIYIYPHNSATPLIIVIILIPETMLFPDLGPKYCARFVWREFLCARI